MSRSIDHGRLAEVCRWVRGQKGDGSGGSRFGRAVVAVSAVYATLMAVFAVVLAVLVLNGPEPGSVGHAAKWAAIPSWSAAAAATTSLRQARRVRSVA
ncbi:MAG: hypothetical protein M5U19_15615 [Microthrixaceae bacterium]|nr:hypothetical protein [Microthrixaceae bacterium]